MRGVFVVFVLLLLIAAPIAMAADGCSGMGTVCGAPCSASCVSTPALASEPALMPIATLAPMVLSRVPAAELRTPDAPPKPLLSA
jgi:hypothetical protein